MKTYTAAVVAAFALCACLEESADYSPASDPASSAAETAETEACTYGTGCDSGDVCDWFAADPGQCVGLDGWCGDDGLCVASGYACSTDDDCPAEVHCRFDAGVCVWGGGASCTVDAECTYAQEYCAADENGDGVCVACENTFDDPECDCGAEPIVRNGCQVCGC